MDRDKRKAEADAIATTAKATWLAIAAERRTKEPRAIVLPTATTEYSELARSRPHRVGDIAMVRAIPVLAPLPDVPMHVVESPGVWLLLADGVGGIATVSPIPPNFVQIRAFAFFSGQILPAV